MRVTYALGSVQKDCQENEMPDKIEIVKDVNQAAINKSIDRGLEGIWIADRDTMIKFEPRQKPQPTAANSTVNGGPRTRRRHRN